MEEGGGGGGGNLARFTNEKKKKKLGYKTFVFLNHVNKQVISLFNDLFLHFEKR